MKQYLYLCPVCGSAFLDGRATLPVWCLCGGSYVIYALPWSAVFLSLDEALWRARSVSLAIVSG